MKADELVKEVEESNIGSPRSTVLALLAIEARLETLSWRLEEIADQLVKED